MFKIRKYENTFSKLKEIFLKSKRNTKKMVEQQAGNRPMWLSVARLQPCRWYANGPVYYALFKPQMTTTTTMVMMMMRVMLLLTLKNHNLTISINIHNHHHDHHLCQSQKGLGVLAYSETTSPPPPLLSIIRSVQICTGHTT